MKRKRSASIIADHLFYNDSFPSDSFCRKFLHYKASGSLPVYVVSLCSILSICVLRNIPTEIFLSRHRSVIWSPLSSRVQCSHHFPRDMHRAGMGRGLGALFFRKANMKNARVPWQCLLSDMALDTGFADGYEPRRCISPHARRWPKTPARRYCPRRDTINTARSWQ